MSVEDSEFARTWSRPLNDGPITNYIIEASISSIDRITAHCMQDCIQ